MRRIDRYALCRAFGDGGATGRQKGYKNKRLPAHDDPPLQMLCTRISSPDCCLLKDSNVASKQHYGSRMHLLHWAILGGGLSLESRVSKPRAETSGDLPHPEPSQA